MSEHAWEQTDDSAAEARARARARARAHARAAAHSPLAAAQLRD